MQDNTACSKHRYPQIAIGPTTRVRTFPVPARVHLGQCFQHPVIFPSRNRRSQNTRTLCFVTTPIQRADMAIRTIHSQHHHTQDNAHSQRKNPQSAVGTTRMARTSPVQARSHLRRFFQHPGIVLSRNRRCLSTETLFCITTAESSQPESPLPQHGIPAI